MTLVTRLDAAAFNENLPYARRCDTFLMTTEGQLLLSLRLPLLALETNWCSQRDWTSHFLSETLAFLHSGRNNHGRHSAGPTQHLEFSFWTLSSPLAVHVLQVSRVTLAHPIRAPPSYGHGDGCGSGCRRPWAA